MEYNLGGGGTNSAAAFSGLGMKTAFLGKVGKGYHSKLIMDYMRQHKIDTKFVVRGNAHSAVSIILDNLEKDRVILAHKGVNEFLLMRDIKLKTLKTKWIYSSSLTGASFETLKKVCGYAVKNNINVAFNPSSYMTEKGIFYLRPVLRNIKVLVFNLHEATLLTKEEKLSTIFRKLLSLGPEIIVITEGKQGVHAVDGTHMYSIKSNHVKVIDTTGAGDAFAASFVAGLIRKKGIEFSLKIGIENATSVIQHIGAKNGLLTWDQALKKIKVDKKKIIKTRLY